jgi:alkyl sulfatase BDS1-like metallo-beta-lactamase superfamily hydrolase
MRILKWVLLILMPAALTAGAVFYFSEDARQVAKIEALDTVGDLAVGQMEKAAEGGNSVAAEFINTPIEAREISKGIYQATGVANAQLVTTGAGHVLFDVGLPTQAAKQYKALEQKVGNLELSHVIISHSHADHSGGVKLWQRDGVEIVAHAEFEEEQRYLTELQDYFWFRNRTLFPFMPETPPTNALLSYGGIEPTIEVPNGKPYKFEQGGVKFEVMALPGAEGADNLVLWLPDKKILLSGDFFGPLFPQFPNVFTMRGEKIRKPVEYIRSLETIIALEPEMIVPSHKDPITDKAVIGSGLVKMRDAVRYVHDATVDGMNAGKTVEQLMEEIALPAELALTQEHGKVSWAVKSIWEYYATWFHFDRTTELYHVPQSAVYADIVEVADAGALTGKAAAYVSADEPLKALHLVDIILGARETDEAALKVRKDALQILLDRAESGSKNSYEIYWLNYRLRDTEEKLSR